MRFSAKLVGFLFFGIAGLAYMNMHYTCSTFSLGKVYCILLAYISQVISFNGLCALL